MGLMTTGGITQGVARLVNITIHIPFKIANIVVIQQRCEGLEKVGLHLRTGKV